jgi:hypothetical protein
MKSHIFSFSKFKKEILLNEAITVDEWFNKFPKLFGNLSLQIVKDIVKADPTSKKGTVRGLYSQWLINLYKNNNLKLEDLYKATEYLTIFDKVKNKLSDVFDKDGKKLHNKDISFYKSLQDLFTVIKPYRDNKELSLSNREQSGKTKIDDEVELFYEDEYIKVEIPLTYRASCALGSGTEWCTATGKTDEYYKHYTKNGDKLYVIFDKDNKNKYQFSFGSQQYMDENDDEIEDFSFLENSPNFFQKIKDVSNLDEFIVHLIDNLNSTNIKLIKFIPLESFGQEKLDYFLWYVIYATLDNPSNTDFYINHDKAIILMDYLVKIGSNVNAVSTKWNRNRPILHYFAAYLNTNSNGMDILNKFLEYKPLIDIRDEEQGNTPLIESAKYRLIAFADILLKNGANPNAKNKKGLNAAFIAINTYNPRQHFSFIKFITLLKNNGLNIKETNRDGLNIVEFYLRNFSKGDKSIEFQKLKELYNS